MMKVNQTVSNKGARILAETIIETNRPRQAYRICMEYCGQCYGGSDGSYGIRTDVTAP